MPSLKTENVYACKKCGYRSKPQPKAVNSMSHRCPADSRDRELQRQ